MRNHVESHKDKESGHKIQSGCNNECQIQISERIKIQFPKCCKVRICSPVLLVHFILLHLCQMTNYSQGGQLDSHHSYVRVEMFQEKEETEGAAKSQLAGRKRGRNTKETMK
jgi:hypothetical protein